MKQDAESIQNVLELLNDTTLRQCMASCNWVRDSIPNYAVIVSPLQDLLKTVLADCSRKTTQVASKKSLGDKWTAVEATVFVNIKVAVECAVTLAHLKEETIVCLFTDASSNFWG